MNLQKDDLHYQNLPMHHYVRLPEVWFKKKYQVN